MSLNRRNFLKSSSMLTAAAVAPGFHPNQPQKVDYSLLDEIMAKPVLKRELFPEPLIIESLELLCYKDNFLCRGRPSLVPDHFMNLKDLTKKFR